MRTNRKRTSRFERGRLFRLLVALYAFIATQGGGCGKEDSFFETETTGVSTITDMEPPIASNIQPTNGTVTNTDNVMFELNDPPLSDGRQGSGVDNGSVTASAGGVDLPVMVNGSMYTVDVSGLADGSHTIVFAYADMTGNAGSTSLMMTLDRNAPAIAYTMMPVSPQESGDPSVMFQVDVAITEDHPGTAEFRVTRVDATGACSATGQPWDAGTDGGQVDNPVQDIAASGASIIMVTAFNGKTAGDPPSVATYCLSTTAADNVQSKTGTLNPNTSFTTFRVDLTWQPPPPPAGFQINTATWWQHFGAFSRYCFQITTQPAQPGAAFVSNTQGPAVFPGNNQQNGNLNNQGMATVGLNIGPAGGLYTTNITVTGAGGVQQMAQAQANVTLAAGAQACP